MSKLFREHHNKNITAAFDVDQTLINADDTPKYRVIELFRAFSSLGCDMIIWSGCGVEYAKRWAEKLGLDARILPKGSISPDIVFDDMETSMG